MDQKTLINQLRDRYGDTRASHTYENLLAYGNAWKLTACTTEDLFAVQMGDKWYFPVGSDEAKKAFLTSRMETGKLSLVYLSEKDAEFLKTCFPGRFRIERDIDHDEYVISLQEHLAESGKKNAELRRRWRRFLENGPSSLKPLTPETQEVAENVLDAWYRTHECTDTEKEKMRTLEYDVFLSEKGSALERYIAYMGKDPFAVVAGYPVNGEIYDLCIAKEDGRYPYANYGLWRLVMETKKDSFRFFNLEEDMGDPGLRAMKSQRLPAYKNEMWKAEFLG